MTTVSTVPVPSAADHPAWDALSRAFAVLDELGADLPERAFAYVTTGAGPEVLLRLAQAGQAAAYPLGEPGRICERFVVCDGERGLAIRFGLQGRRNFYSRVGAEPDFAGAALARCGRLLESVDGGRHLERPDNGMPGWLQYLANDLVWFTFAAARNLVGSDCAAAKLDALALVWRAARAEGLDDLEVAVLAFERKDWPDGHPDLYEPLLNRPTLLALFDALGAARWGALLARLSLSGRSRLLDVVNVNRLPARYHALLIHLAVDGSKSVRNYAQKYLAQVDPALRGEVLCRVLDQGNAAEREQAVLALGQEIDPAGLQKLAALRERETSKPVLAAIQHVFSKQSVAASARELEAPALQEDESLLGGRLGESALAILQEGRLALRAYFERMANSEIEANAKSKWEERFKPHWAQRNWKDYQDFGEDRLDRMLETLNGDAKHSLEGDPQYTLEHALALVDLPEFGLVHLTRWLAREPYGMSRWWNHPATQRWIAKVGPERVDLRLLARHFQAAGATFANMVRPCLVAPWDRQPSPLERLPADRVWPFFAEHPQCLAYALGAETGGELRYERYSPEQAFALLGLFPSLPPKLIPVLFDLALGENKVHRVAAQRLLLRLPNLLEQVVKALAASKQELRASAALWLADIGDAAATDPLLAALEKESRETARAAMLTALERLGVDISPFTAPEKLLAEAEKGLKAKPPVGLAWFPFAGLPPLRWADGGDVPAEIPRWWVVLACKLKEPAGNPLLTRYLDRLDPASRAALGGMVLRAFIGQDTRGPAPEDAWAWAQQEAPTRLASYHSWARYPGYEHYAGMTLEDVQQELQRERLATYLGSAIGEKGVLALAAGIPGHEAVTLLQAYLRDHHRRRAQIEAMLEALAGSDDPALIQLLIALARRHRTAGVQEKAKSLVGQIAARNGWSQEQLADRTMPSAGFDERGVLTIDYGERRFTVTLDADLKPVLANPEGKVVKALPEARKQDDPEQIKEAKNQFSACKKELKQVLELQAARLYDAMCAGRAWPVAEWRDYLLNHPIVGRLAQRLVWLHHDGETTRAFRPTEDGGLIDVADEEIELGEQGSLWLAHAALLAADAAKAWRKHFKDYKLKPLFAQLDRSLPALDDPEASLIEDRRGWLSDAFTLRGHFNKLGYLRGEVIDGGFFSEYRKPFPTAALQAAIEFSGNCLPEENVVAALKGLRFYRLDDGYGSHPLPLRQVPPVLLAEVYADYHQLADVCAGFNPDWESKVPW